ncbi:hypothetical protein Bca52824_072608 [Brassica carinata]|uniref:Sinigrinase n=1 Tax=Brassica carinata TaxID=52824 RepID=A0A8X7U539_BRACI|nr:hypothetical protein Bca52824_072608 [Brassica carinata]
MMTMTIMMMMMMMDNICIRAQDISRGNFPKGFVFGTASSAFQYEGAVKEDGRGPTIWDTFSHTFGKITDFSNADVAVDQYHRYEEDVQLMKNLGMDAYRFSISWARIFPNGVGQINEAGINQQTHRWIEPYVTLYHWDLPQVSGHINYVFFGSNDFAAYAEVCFQRFGDRVKHWITFNEPQTFSIHGYAIGLQAPGRCSILFKLTCRSGNSSTEPYIVGHNVILSHATVSDIYRKKYKAKQGGSLGLAFNVAWFEPESNKTEDIEAAQRAQDFQLGWFLDPLMFGDYPSSMRSRVGSRLPVFTGSQSVLVKGSLDFVGINHYTTYYARNNATNLMGTVLDGAFSDSGTVTQRKKNAHFANSLWLYIVPRGMRSVMNYVKHRYGNLRVFITENGMDDPNNILIPREEALKDGKRIRYHHDYLSNLQAAIKEDGCNVKGYFAWSLLDNWEWAAGYSSRFGLYFVDYRDNLKRYPKDSVHWFTSFLNSTS